MKSSRNLMSAAMLGAAAVAAQFVSGKAVRDALFLKPAIRQRLWPFLERVPVKRSARPREEVIADLLRSNHSIALNLEELKQREMFLAAEAAV
jgi:hypothetical protein